MKAQDPAYSQLHSSNSNKSSGTQIKSAIISNPFLDTKKDHGRVTAASREAPTPFLARSPWQKGQKQETFAYQHKDSLISKAK